MATFTPFSTATLTSSAPSASLAATAVAWSWMATLSSSNTLKPPDGSGVVFVKVSSTPTSIVRSAGRTS